MEISNDDDLFPSEGAVGDMEPQKPVDFLKQIDPDHGNFIDQNGLRSPQAIA